MRLADPEEVARVAAERVTGAAADAVSARGRFLLVLAGGSTPRRLYERLARIPFREQLPWRQTHALFGDERCVPPEDPRSNYRAARETLLDHVRIPTSQIHRIEGELPDPAEAASRYERALRRLDPDQPFPRFDLLLLGVGEDGHTASLFPGTAALEESDRRVVANHVPRLDEWRITMTLPALCAARHVLFLITGTSKARVVAEAFGSLPHPTTYPCELVVPMDGRREVLVDREAASRLPAS